MDKKLIRLTEADLHRIVKQSVNRVLSEGKPADRQIGRHKFKGLKYDKNGNPIYTHPSKLDDPEGGTLSDDDLKAHGWKFSPKHGLHGQIQDPTRLPESVIRELEELPGFNDPHGLVSSINDMSPETFENQEIFEVAAEDAIRRLKDCGQEISLMNVIDEMGLKDIIEKAIKDYYPSDINPRVYYNR